MVLPLQRSAAVIITTSIITTLSWIQYLNPLQPMMQRDIFHILPRANDFKTNDQREERPYLLNKQECVVQNPSSKLGSAHFE
jgi:hypothetical protein